MRAEPHLLVIKGEVGDAPPQLEQHLTRAAVALVLLHGVGDGLLGQVVLQLEREHRKPVDERHEVERELRLILAVAELPGDGEPVECEALRGARVPWAGRPVEQVEVVLAMLEAGAQHVDRAAPCDLALQPREEVSPRRAVVREVERFRDLALGRLEEHRELDEVDRIRAVVVVWAAFDPAPLAIRTGGLGYATADGRCHARHRRDNQAFEAKLARIGGHGATSSSSGANSSAVASSISMMSSRAAESTPGNPAAASLTSSLPVTTSATRRVRYSRSRST